MLSCPVKYNSLLRLTQMFVQCVKIFFFKVKLLFFLLVKG